MSRVSNVLHGGKQLLRIDFTGCVPGAFAPIISEAVQVICSQPPGSVGVVTVFDEDVLFNASTVVEIQRFASRVMPHLRKQALVGLTGMKRVAFNAIKPLFRVPVELFADEPSATAWVARA